MAATGLQIDLQPGGAPSPQSSGPPSARPVAATLPDGVSPATANASYLLAGLALKGSSDRTPDGGRVNPWLYAASTQRHASRGGEIGAHRQAGGDDSGSRKRSRHGEPEDYTMATGVEDDDGMAETTPSSIQEGVLAAPVLGDVSAADGGAAGGDGAAGRNARRSTKRAPAAQDGAEGAAQQQPPMDTASVTASGRPRRSTRQPNNAASAAAAAAAAGAVGASRSEMARMPAWGRQQQHQLPTIPDVGAEEETGDGEGDGSDWRGGGGRRGSRREGSVDGGGGGGGTDARRYRKNTRERQRRFEVNDAFDLLTTMLGVTRRNKSDKVTVLEAAITEINQLRALQAWTTRVLQQNGLPTSPVGLEAAAMRAQVTRDSAPPQYGSGGGRGGGGGGGGGGPNSQSDNSYSDGDEYPEHQQQQQVVQAMPRGRGAGGGGRGAAMSAAMPRGGAAGGAVVPAFPTLPTRLAQVQVPTGPPGRDAPHPYQQQRTWSPGLAPPGAIDPSAYAAAGGAAAARIAPAVAAAATVPPATFVGPSHSTRSRKRSFSSVESLALPLHGGSLDADADGGVHSGAGMAAGGHAGVPRRNHNDSVVSFEGLLPPDAGLRMTERPGLERGDSGIAYVPLTGRGLDTDPLMRHLPGGIAGGASTTDVLNGTGFLAQPPVHAQPPSLSAVSPYMNAPGGGILQTSLAYEHGAGFPSRAPGHHQHHHQHPHQQPPSAGYAIPHPGMETQVRMSTASMTLGSSPGILAAGGRPHAVHGMPQHGSHATTAVAAASAGSAAAPGSFDGEHYPPLPPEPTHMAARGHHAAHNDAYAAAWPAYPQQAQWGGAHGPSTRGGDSAGTAATAGPGSASNPGQPPLPPAPTELAPPQPQHHQQQQPQEQQAHTSTL